MADRSDALHRDEVRRAELGEFLRSRRARLTPEMFGLPGGSRRRTPGLRREEVAQLCGLSTTWYTWLEQGRDISLSAAALGRLARILRFSAAERRYLFELAGRHDPDPGGDDDPGALGALSGLVNALPDAAYVLDASWTARAWNGAAAALFTGWLDGDHDRNQLRYIFLSPAARTLIVDWEERARRVLAEFRSDYSRHIDDPVLEGLVTELSAGSAFFAQSWGEHTVLGREGGERAFAHPRHGRIGYTQVTLTPVGHPDLKLVVLRPATAPDSEKNAPVTSVAIPSAGKTL